MQYLYTLKDDLINAFDVLTPDKVSLFIVNGEMANSSSNISYIARFLFLDCRVQNPFNLLGFIRKWFESHNMEIPNINFASEIIDLETYDFEIDINLMDSLAISDNGMDTLVCYPPVWSDKLGAFVKGNIAVEI